MNSMHEIDFVTMGENIDIKSHFQERPKLSHTWSLLQAMWQNLETLVV